MLELVLDTDREGAPTARSGSRRRPQLALTLPLLARRRSPFARAGRDPARRAPRSRSSTATSCPFTFATLPRILAAASCSGCLRTGARRSRASRSRSRCGARRHPQRPGRAASATTLFIPVVFTDRLARRLRASGASSRRRARPRSAPCVAERERDEEARAAVRGGAAADRARAPRRRRAQRLGDDRPGGRRAPAARARSRSASARRCSRSRRPGGRRSPRCGACSGSCAAPNESPALAPQPGMATLGDARRAGARRRPAGRVPRRGRPGRAAARDRPVRVPDRAGGAHERAQARRPGPRAGVRPLPARRARARDRERRAATANGDGDGHGLVGMRAARRALRRQARRPARAPERRLPCARATLPLTGGRTA